MRDARAQDFWSRAYRRLYTDCLLEIKFNGLNNLPDFSFPQGLLVLCGLNGAGKSTILSAVKDVVGLPLSDQDLHRIKSRTINCKAKLSGNDVLCSNTDGERLIDKGWDEEKIIFLDSTDSVSVQNYIVCQTNLEELLEQFEEYELPESDVEEINYLIGKKYTTCTIRELEDVSGSNSIIPYFLVEVDGIKYDSKSMGYGEHFLLYLFWRINKVDKDTLLIIEEPETFISITSQTHFANYLGEQMAKKGVKVILTTHSPYILENIRNNNVRIVSRVGNIVSIVEPDENLPAESILGLDNSNIGTFFVEDIVAAEFLSTVLEDRCPQLLRSFTIDSVGGEAEITSRLSFPYSDRIKYKFIGVYDGDMRTTIDTSKLNWSYCFLPGAKAIEEVLRECLHQPGNIQKLCSHLDKDEQRVIAMLAVIDGRDCHDWYNELRKFLMIDGKSLMTAFYQTLLKDNEDMEAFLTELTEAINTHR